MVASSVVSSLKLCIGARGGTSNGQEDALAEVVRSRLNAKVKDKSLAIVQRAQLMYGLSAVILHLIAVVPASETATWTAEKTGEIAFECLEAIARRTQII